MDGYVWIFSFLVYRYLYLCYSEKRPLLRNRVKNVSRAEAQLNDPQFPIFERKIQREIFEFSDFCTFLLDFLLRTSIHLRLES